MASSEALWRSLAILLAAALIGLITYGNIFEKSTEKSCSKPEVLATRSSSLTPRRQEQQQAASSQHSEPIIPVPDSLKATLGETNTTGENTTSTTPPSGEERDEASPTFTCPDLFANGTFASNCSTLSTADVLYPLHVPGANDAPSKRLRTSLERNYTSTVVQVLIQQSLRVWSDPATNITRHYPSTRPPRARARTQKHSYLRCEHRHAFVTYAAGYGSNVLSKLVAEFQAVHSPCDDLIFFVKEKPVDMWLPDTGMSANVIFELVRNYEYVMPKKKYRLLMNNGPDIVSWVRVAVISEWLDRHWNQYKYIVTSDTRDIAIFANLFTPLYRLNMDGLFSIKEQLSLDMKSMNHHWIQKCFGRRYQRYVAKERLPATAPSGKRLGPSWTAHEPLPVLCNGIIGGTAEAVVDYFAVYKQLALRRGRKIGCMDQATHIFLQYTLLAEIDFPHNVYIMHNKVAPYRHLYLDEVARRDRRGRHINCLREPYSIVHQLDRDKLLWADAVKGFHFLDKPPLGGVRSNSTKKVKSPSAKFLDTPTFRAVALCSGVVPNSTVISRVVPEDEI